MAASAKPADQMAGPRKLGPYPDRDLDCQESLETRFLALVDQAEAAGWVRIEIYDALIELIENHAIGDHTLEADMDAVQRAIRDRR
ncbi:hypothetical protein [Paracoccus zhejiangensis]|uniref:Uncharacterized protein n=1 Tax=Paracoccus zhejiangensis TaxID=1077935 RepID=A0A2H5F5M9_9RHOB|nr:hypothetical protein [Paracoccus zhejiangensis]AUH66834.1 hypothetical protein CX676_21295 [Paracoccus zhejiangensis]